ncbi:MAG: hypothetical protein HKL80_02365 [Acidimicrobiales bacterium]|nr:hypothetical protein [Acidimicrobiales bacterium]
MKTKLSQSAIMVLIISSALVTLSIASVAIHYLLPDPKGNTLVGQPTFPIHSNLRYQAEQDISNSIISANSRYTIDGGSYGDSGHDGSSFYTEVSKMDPAIHYIADSKFGPTSSSGLNTVSIVATDCTFDAKLKHMDDCQEVIMSAYSSYNGDCYFAFLSKDGTPLPGNVSIFGAQVNPTPPNGLFMGGRYDAVVPQVSKSGGNKMASCSLDVVGDGVTPSGSGGDQWSDIEHSDIEMHPTSIFPGNVGQSGLPSSPLGVVTAWSNKNA